MQRAFAPLALAVFLASALPLAAQDRCQSWLDVEFWKITIAGEVADCLAAGADPNARSEGGWTRLHSAAEFSDPATVETLLAAGADPNARNEGGATPLHSASYSDYPATVETLLAAGADPNARSESGLSPLHSAASRGTRQGEAETSQLIMGTLLAAGADPNARSEDGDTPADHCPLSLVYPSAGPKCRALLAGGAAALRTASLARTARGRCLIPGFPRPADPESLGFPWCPASVDFQIRVFALTAAGAQCAIATGSSSTPEQIEARNREIADVCTRLDAVAERFGGAECRCPADWRE